MITETTKRPRKARTEKICAECNKTIEKGTTYIGNSDLFEGKYSALHRHSDCIEAADLLMCEVKNHATHGRFMLTVLIERNAEIVPKLGELLVDYPLVLGRVT